MRPQSITFLCVILFAIGSSLAIRSIAQLFLAPSFYAFFMLIISLIGLYCYNGLWNMKHWSISLFFLVWGAIALPVFFAGEPFSTIKLLHSLYLIGVPVLFIVVVFPHKRELSNGQVWPLNRDQ